MMDLVEPWPLRLGTDPSPPAQDDSLLMDSFFLIF